jgi:hypothetical protein
MRFGQHTRSDRGDPILRPWLSNSIEPHRNIGRVQFGLDRGVLVHKTGLCQLPPCAIKGMRPKQRFGNPPPSRALPRTRRSDDIWATQLETHFGKSSTASRRLGPSSPHLSPSRKPHQHVVRLDRTEIWKFNGNLEKVTTNGDCPARRRDDA